MSRNPATVTDEEIKLALKLYPWPHFCPDQKYINLLSTRLGITPRKAPWREQVQGRVRLVQRILEHATTGNPTAHAASLAGLVDGAEDWARHFIWQSDIGMPVAAAFDMFSNKQLSLRELKQIVENKTTKDCAEIAYRLWHYAEVYNEKNIKIDLDWLINLLKNPRLPYATNFIERLVKQKLIPVQDAQQIIERHELDDISMAAGMLHFTARADIKWVRNIIRRATTGSPACEALRLYRSGRVSAQWTRKTIELATCGKVAGAACILASDPWPIFDDQIEWAYRVIRNAKSGDPARWLWRLYLHDCEINNKSVNKNKYKILDEIANCEYGNPAETVVEMHRKKFITLSKAKKAIEKITCGTPVHYAHVLIGMHHTQIGWLKDLILLRATEDARNTAYWLLQDRRISRAWYENYVINRQCELSK